MAEAGVVARSPHAAWVESPDRVVICVLDRPAAEPVVVAGTGATMWLALAAPLTVAALVQEMARRHGVDDTTVAADVTGFVAALVAAGALQVSPAAGGT